MNPKPEPLSPTADREIVISRVFTAPRHLVYRAWTDAARLSAWWGPRGFTTTTSEFDMRVGGRWIYVMHGPDGTDYDNWIRYQVIEPNERLVYEHGGSAGDAQVHFHVTVTFTDLGPTTAVIMRSLFPSAAARDLVVQRYRAIEGGQQTLARLAEQLMSDGTPDTPPAGTRRYRFTRSCAAPRDLVYRAWTDEKHLARWWGPKGFTNPRCEFAARAGGPIHIDMTGPDGTVYPMGGTVLEVTPPERLAFTSVAVDDQGIAQLENLNVITFAEDHGRTTVTVETTVLMATAMGEMFLKGIEPGWSSSLERMEAEAMRMNTADS
jgi:uncharacterized protein YndB with AHSA1/START domain